MSKTENRIQYNIQAHRRKKAWQRIVGILACLVVFCTTYALILPAITRENQRAQGDNNLGMNHGTIINLFDYWITERDTADNTWSAEMLEQGINLGHALKFSDGNPYRSNDRHINKWTGSKAPYSGIVANRLGDDGFPYLNQEVANSSESLAYLFDSKAEDHFRITFHNATDLLQLDSEGYYNYDSATHFAQFDETTKTFTIRDDPAPAGNGFFYPFNTYEEVSGAYPNGYDSVINHYFGLSMVTRFVQEYGGHTTPSKRAPMVFEFSGDDDVWIFIDGVLVADLGGIHDKAGVSMDFSKGKVTINGSETAMVDAFKAVYGESYDPLTNGWEQTIDGSYIFADGTYHTMKFFYLERGNYASNMHIKSNLQYYPATAVTKVDQYDKPVQGAKFAVYAANAVRNSNGSYDYTMLSNLNGTAVTPPTDPQYDVNGNLLDESGNVLAKALYVGTTDQNGDMVFVDEDGLHYPLSELETILGQYFIMREIHVPDGYRWVGGEMFMEISTRAGQSQVLLCHNTYDCGVYADPILHITAPDTLLLSSKQNLDGVSGVTSTLQEDGTYLNTASYVTGGENALETHGSLFVVVLKYVGRTKMVNGNTVVDTAGYDSLDAALGDIHNWAPVWGNGEIGYTLENIGADGSFITSAITAAKQYTDSSNVFSLGQSAQMQGALSGMPGDVSTYYYMLGEDEKEKTMYTASYYWTTENIALNGWDHVLAGNTYLVDSSPAYSAYEFVRVFGSSIRVPDLYNRMLVQKKDPNGKLINGAHFGLYGVVEKQDDNTSGNATTVYYKTAGGRLVYLRGTNEAITDGGQSGTYTMAEDGIITVTLGDGTSDTIQPLQTAESKTQYGEDGTAEINVLNIGCYILREIKAPVGYSINPAEVMVLVTKNAIYANAGKADDGVVVGRGPGYVVSSLDEFASQDQIDNTLSWIYQRLRVTAESTSFQLSTKLQNDSHYYPSDTQPDTVYLEYKPKSETGSFIFNYVVNEERYQTLDYTQEEIAAVRRRMFTDVGWSYNELRQDYAYGQAHIYDQAIKANYRNLENKDLTRLFSRSVYVQITDEAAPGDLEISKKVEGQPEGTTAPSFNFQVELANATLQTLEGTFDYTVYATADTGRQNPLRTGSIASGDALTLTDQEVAVIRGLPKGTNYTVTETLNLRYSTTAVRDQGKAAIENAGEKSFGNVVSGTLYWQTGEDWVDHCSTVAYTNIYIKDLQIVKADSSDHNKLLSDAEFTLTKTIEHWSEGTKLKYYSVEKAAWVDDYTVLTTDQAGRIPLDSTQFREGGPFTLTEIKAPAGYQKQSAAILLELNYRQNGWIREYYFDASSHSGGASFAIQDDGLTLVVYNAAGHKLPDTGGVGTSGIYAAGAALLFVSGLGAVLTGKREKRYEK